MRKIYLKEFALTGVFGSVKIGMTKKQVIEFLGEPDFDYDYGTGSTGLQYSWYEFFFEKKTEILKSIQNDHLQNDCEEFNESIFFKNDKVEVDAWFFKLNRNLTRKEVKEILNQQEISFSEEEYWGNEIIRFKSEVYLDFDNKENFVLNGIRYFPDY